MITQLNCQQESMALKHLFRKNLPLLIGILPFCANTQAANAVLNYYIFQDGPDVVLHAEGVLDLPTSFTSGVCGSTFAFGTISNKPFSSTNLNAICTGINPSSNFPFYRTSTPSLWTVPIFEFLADGSTTSTATITAWGPAYTNFFNSGIYGSNVLSGGTISSTSIFSNKDLNADFGFTTSGLVSSLTLLPADNNDPYTANDTINVYIGAPPAVPAPMPLIGAGAALGWSRQLRRRVSGG